MPVDLVLVETDQACSIGPGSVALERSALLSFLWAVVTAALSRRSTLLLGWHLGDFSRPQLQTVLSLFSREVRIRTVLVGSHLVLRVLLIALLLLLLSELSVLLLSVASALACAQVPCLADWSTPWLLSRARHGDRLSLGSRRGH